MATAHVSLLIVDDHAEWCEGLASALASHSTAVTIAYAGPDASAAIHAGRQCTGAVLALVDAHAPDGSANVATLRALGAPAQPVAVVSAHAEPEVIRSLVAAGSFGFVPKSDLLAGLDGLVAAAANGGSYITAVLSASLLTTPDAARLEPSKRQALQWHAAGVPLAQALQAHGLGDDEFAAAIEALIGAIREPAHGTDTSS